MPKKMIPPFMVYCSHCGKDLANTPTQRSHARAGERVYCPAPAPCRRLGRPEVIKQPLDERFGGCTRRLPNGCLEWTGTVIWNGYGQILVDGKIRYAHHVAWFLKYGEWPPPGFELDHVCHNPDLCRLGKKCPHRRCAEWSHLELLIRHTGGNNSAERSAAGVAAAARAALITHCPAGHEYTGENLYICKNGKRSCKECKRRQQRGWRERQKMEINHGRE